MIDNFKSKGVVSEADGDNKDVVFDSPVTEWIIQRPQRGTIAFTTKPAFDVFGYLYFFDVNNETMTKILGDIKGLTTLTNKNKTKILFSESVKDSFKLNIFGVSGNDTSRLAIKTLPEKCVWSNNNITVYCGIPEYIKTGDYPDVWYQGLTSFSDKIWKINIETKIAELIISPKDFINTQMDLTKLILNEDEKYLFFINKKDSSLWSLKLE